ncbi:LuxR C-terminal-related transcriptional regulator [Kitasatospora sp. NPDC053057]|uniref:helix-turn-helix transcriptional regulator n=1 Tax=Kitasatospora sp. NPDC053057 TaxID=3364062 RepID=UPI0037C61193
MDTPECGSGGCDTGICEAGIRRYREAVENGSTTTTGIPNCLTLLGLLEPVREHDERVVPVAPVVASGRAFIPLEQETARLRRQMQSLNSVFESVEALYRSARQQRLPSVTVLRGGELIDRAIEASVNSCESELITAQPGGRRPQAILDTALTRNLELLRRGVRQRTLYQHAARSDSPTFGYATKIVSAGGEVRTVDELFDRLIVCDRTVAYIPTSPEYAQEALEIRHPAVVRFMVNVFERVWDRAIPIRVRGERRPHAVVADLEQGILRLLVEGFTEDKIARNLGIGRRTVAEHVSRISKRLGSTSRTQLGYLIAVNGLVSRQD